jgi:hypothetical protein
MDLTAEEIATLGAIAHQHPNASRSALVETTRLADRKVRLALDALRAKELANYTGERRWARWHLTGSALQAYGLDETHPRP